MSRRPTYLSRAQIVAHFLSGQSVATLARVSGRTRAWVESVLREAM